jgi:hypothetical protein
MNKNTIQSVGTRVLVKYHTDATAGKKKAHQQQTTPMPLTFVEVMTRQEKRD